MYLVSSFCFVRKNYERVFLNFKSYSRVLRVSMNDFSIVSIRCSFKVELRYWLTLGAMLHSVLIIPRLRALSEPVPDNRYRAFQEASDFLLKNLVLIAKLIESVTRALIIPNTLLFSLGSILSKFIEDGLSIYSDNEIIISLYKSSTGCK